MSFEASVAHRGTVIICDRCGMTEEYDDSRVYIVADIASESGWSVESNERALCPECARAVDDELEQIRRDAEIDARVSPIGELFDWDVLP